MDTLSKVLNLVQTGDFAISLDLKDGYFHIKIFNGKYQFKALCIGPKSAPRIFRKVMSVVAAN